jgi:Tfp pilus assembly protein PilZ
VEALAARCTNVSLGGMLLNTEQQLTEGTDLRIWLELPETGELFVTGTVIWTDGASAGVRHELLGSGDTVTLSEYLASLA